MGRIRRMIRHRRDRRSIKRFSQTRETFINIRKDINMPKITLLGFTPKEETENPHLKQLYDVVDAINEGYKKEYGDGNQENNLKDYFLGPDPKKTEYYKREYGDDDER
tara:strand:+ start:2794 stop:3117 length:324 start_codon:yes stop_codon:yes gene_type:complete